MNSLPHSPETTAYRPLHFRDIHKGDVLYENGPMLSLEVRVCNEPWLYAGLWRFEGETALGTIPYLMSEQYSHYGPQLTRKPTRPNVKHLTATPAPSGRSQPRPAGPTASGEETT